MEQEFAVAAAAAVAAVKPGWAAMVAQMALEGIKEPGGYQIAVMAQKIARKAEAKAAGVWIM